MHIRTENLRKKYGWVTALDGVSLEVQPGQILAILGTNGAGKTTLLNALAGVVLLDSGNVFFDSELWTPARGDLRQRLAFIPDLLPVPAHWTPLRFISTTLKLYGMETAPFEHPPSTQGSPPSETLPDRVLAVLEKLDLLDVAGWRIGKLSRGQIYKSVLAAFLVADPEVWLLDEPFASGMDPRGLNCFKEYSREATNRGRTIIYTTQIIEVAEKFSDRFCVMDRGKVKACGLPHELRTDSSFSDLITELREQPPS